MRRKPKRHGLQMEHDVPLSAPVTRPPMPPRRSDRGIIERGGVQPQNPPGLPEAQSHVPGPPGLLTSGAGMTQEWVRLSDREPWMPPGTVGVYLSDINTDMRALLGYFAPGNLKNVVDTVKAEGIHGKEGAQIYAGTFFADGDIAGFEIFYEPE